MARSAAAPRPLGRRFLLQWVASISLAIVAAAGVEYLVGARQVYQVTLDDATATYVQHAEQISYQVDGVANPMRRLAMVYAELGRLESSTPGLVNVAVYDGGARLLSQRGGRADHPPTAEQIAEVARTGEPIVDRHRDEVSQTQHYSFLLLIDSADGPMVLHLVQEARVMQALVTELAWAKLAGLGMMLAVAVPLSYLIGGRALQRRQLLAEEAAATDPLTGLGARRAFVPVLEAQARGSQRMAVSLAVFDLDEFKLVNDQHGHAYGDCVLQAVGVATDALRAGDTTYRLGGDEFAVVLPGADAEAAVHVLERFRARFAELSGGVTLSVGVATAARGTTVEPQDLWDRADAAVYEAKHQGRRRTVVWAPPDREREGTGARA